MYGTKYSLYGKHDKVKGHSEFLDIAPAHFYGAVMGRKQDNLTPLKEIISHLFQEGNLPFNPDDARIWELWDDAVGEAIARHARPLWIKQGVLRVDVSNSIWLQELEYLGDDVKSRVNRKLGRCAVERIEFRLGTG